ncbi:DUF3311 domain-containing protein [Brevibacterium sp. CFH 10365]|uniref:DUF3311 domain-containing protein n=1 Tax=Brevibacterium sp. CFH 10365 TaxID=2585207 RepID=UPI0012662754|nr:DUF3311 domain-containing protein [Brevibacterium sp. CFH 10365]
MSRTHDSQPPSGPPRRRFSLFLLIIPVIGYVLTPLVANTVEPRIFGLPFIVSYTIIVTILTWLCVWMAARGDRFYRGDLPEHVPSDVAFGEDHPIDEGTTAGTGSSAPGDDTSDGSEAGK